MKGITMMISKILLIFILGFSLISCQLQILGPTTLTEKMKNYMTDGSINYDLGNFGEIPFGKTVVGFVFYQNADWCNFDQTFTPPGIEKDPDGDYSPIFLVDYSNNCSLTRQAYNVRARGGRIMLLVSIDSSFMEDENKDDVTGNRVDIPTVIIKKKEGNELKEFIKNNPIENVIISMKFTGDKKGNLEFEFFLKSDDIKSLHFFKEFEQYFQKLKDKMIFKPYYKYYKSPWDETSNTPNAKDSTAPCVTINKYCAHDNTKLKITNPRVILIESIRQTCIYESSKENLELYWSYMINFSDACVDLNNLMFTENCSLEMMKLTGINVDVINNCIDKTIKDGESGHIARHYNQFKSKNVHKTPEILLNGKRYKGTWLAKNIFNAICSGFLDDDTFCATPKPEVLIKNEGGLGVGGVLLMIVLIIIIMLIVLICYKRVVNKSLEASLNEKIQQQTIHSLGQYQVLKDENTGRKTIDISKL